MSDAEIGFLRRADLLEVVGGQTPALPGKDMGRAGWWLVAFLLLVATLALSATLHG
jgi:hypothetical protein